MATVQGKQVSARIGGFFFVLPSILAIAIFVYGMIAYTFNVSLTNRNSASVKDIKHVGFKNYTELFADERFLHALGNLLKFTGVFLVGTLVSGFIMALLLEKGVAGEGIFRSFTFTRWRFLLLQWARFGVGC